MTTSIDGTGEVAAEVSRAIRRLGQIPADARRYTTGIRAAEKQFGLTEADLQRLVEAGLPHGGDADAPLFDTSDLRYLGIRLGTARAYLAQFSFMRRSLERFAAREATQLDVQYIPHLPDGGERVIELFLPGRGRTRVEVAPSQVAAEITVTVESAYPAAPPEVVQAAGHTGALELYALPDILRGDARFARRAGLSECFTAAHVTAWCCSELDLPVRLAEGLLVSIPWSKPHHWCEVLVEGRWCPLDPLMVRALRAHASLDARDWPSHRFLPMVARFGEGALPLVTSTDGEIIPTTLLTSESPC
jgi:hypothetical protein